MTSRLVLPTCHGLGLFLALCTGWYAFCEILPSRPAALLCLAGLWGTAVAGGYRVGLRRRQAFLSATLAETSWLRGILSGRVVSCLAAVVTASLSVPVVAAFTLLAAPWELTFALGTAVLVAAVFMMAVRIMSPHLTALYSICLVAPAATLITGGLMAAGATFIAYGVDVNAASEASGTLPEAIMRARAGLPETIPLIEPLVMGLLVLDVAGNWLLATGGYTATIPLALFLVNGAAVHLGVARVAVDLQAAFYPREKKGVR